MNNTKKEAIYTIDEAFPPALKNDLFDPKIKEVHIWGFGKFVKQEVPARKRNVLINGKRETVQQDPYLSFKFKPSKKLLEFFTER